MTKDLILQEDITVLNACVLNIRASKYIKQKLIEVEGEIDRYIMIVGDFNIPLSIIYRLVENHGGYGRPKIQLTNSN